MTTAYNNTPVLWDINADVPEGVIMGIIGPNGAGKSTFIKSILGLVKPVAGSTKIYGKPYKSIQKSHMSPKRKCGLGFSPQQYLMWL